MLTVGLGSRGSSPPTGFPSLSGICHPRKAGDPGSTCTSRNIKCISAIVAP